MNHAHTLARLPALAFLIVLALVPAGKPSSASGTDDGPTLIDFSYAGYGGGAALPSVPDALVIRPGGGDDTDAIQAALDRIARLPPKADGFRGALRLSAGRFRVSGRLRLRASGVVLRGSADARRPTTIVAAGIGRRTLVEIGADEAPTLDKAVRVTDEKAPAGARTLTVESTEGFEAGARVVVRRPSTAEWIAALGMNKAEGSFADQRLHWTPGSRDLVWDRKVLSVEHRRKQLTLDAPVTTALEARYGGGTVARVTSNEPARGVGLEQLTLESEFDKSNPRDEEHSWIGVALDNVEDAWVRGVTARHFAGSAVWVGRRARRVTVEGCRAEHPVSEVGGYRRQSFFVEGQQVLVRDCRSEAGLNDFAAGFCAGGPNVFLECTATSALGPSGAFESWASGFLYERVRVEGAGLRLAPDTARAQGAGWTSANSVLWNCEATETEARGPEDAPNHKQTSTQSLYQTQLAKRQPIADFGLRIAESPAVEPRQRPRNGLNAQTTRPTRTPPSAIRHPQSKSSLQIVNGRFVADGRVVWGGMLNGAWWKGQVSPWVARASGGVSVTRFVPGRVGPGLTEDLPQLATRMKAEGMPFFNGGHGLWYDRRRDDHTILARTDANVWAPFYEMPWARSGRGKAWDGLSLYDLTRFNPWYFARTREFARLCQREGLVYYHSLYNTHNLLETAAHWVDFPWRPANNVNDTGLPEPPPLEARNTVHVANQFYSTDHPGRRALHRAYILHTLEQLGGSPNVVLTLGFQFAGPLAFQQFFLDTVAEWERKSGREVSVALVTSKDITDAILEDPERARLVSVVDMRYWQYMPDGSLWAPQGGRNLAFREMITQEFKRAGDAPPPTTPAEVYRQVREYRDRHPSKAIVAWHGGAGPIPVLLGGGAQAITRNPAAGQSQGAQADSTHLDTFVREHLSGLLMNMSPRDGLLEDAAWSWCLADERGGNVLIYSLAGVPSIKFARALQQRNYEGTWFDPRTGKAQPLAAPDAWAAGTALRKPTEEDWLLLLRRKR